MNLTTESTNGLAIVRVGETRLMYPMLGDFSSTVAGLIARGEKKLLIDLATVTYVDSATIGCFMDLYRQRGVEAVGRAEACRDHADHDRGAQLPAAPRR
jgi:hypothetical protein